ncbi:MAG: protein TolQ [Proteobacteria bacterium]|jgi:biopolymer transport protein TolQ|nr:protein TolQ [Pseudomonadota bacterium]MBK7116411.1 protein TolQ [Pseudomonadota bacterium]MBK9253079.1 protein TolQ [Pseudomonadota bacterium]
MNAEPLSMLKLVGDASIVVQLVLGVLLAASIGSWAIILGKRAVLARARAEAERFEANFWSGGDLGSLYRTLEARGGNSGMSSIFEMGFREFARLRQGGVPADQLLEGARRAMRVAQLKELDRLEHNLAMLATIGSVSPYVGLFGTVWGIMGTFVALGGVQQATLATVAPGIAEALVATAFALVAAIPAFIAYNRYADKVGRLEMRYDAFMEEFSSILQRHAGRPPAGEAA